MKNILGAILVFILIANCDTNKSNKELKVLDNSDSEEITFIIELNTKGNETYAVEEFTQYLFHQHFHKVSKCYKIHY